MRVQCLEKVNFVFCGDVGPLPQTPFKRGVNLGHLFSSAVDLCCQCHFLLLD